MVREIEWIERLGELGRMVDGGGNERGLLDFRFHGQLLVDLVQ
jgi:hypothetical protein